MQYSKSNKIGQFYNTLHYLTAQIPTKEKLFSNYSIQTQHNNSKSTHFHFISMCIEKSFKM